MIIVYPKKTINVIDAGSNIGAFTVFFQKQFPNSKYALIEPDPENLRLLKLNLIHNNILNYKIFKGGLWDEDTFLKTHRNFRDGGDWAIRVSKSDTPTELKAYTINTILQMMDFDIIDVLKIDIEGSEKEVFQNEELASLFLAKTKFIVVEIHDEFHCRDQITNLLGKNNFELIQICESTFGVNRDFIKPSL